jgi:hypothetical protein
MWTSVSPWAVVLRRLGPRDLASLAGAGRGSAAAVAATALMKWAKGEKNRRCSLWRSTFMYMYFAPRLCLRGACSLAAYDGHLEVLKWLHSTGCPWDSSTCDAAAVGGSLGMLSWLHKMGCPSNAATCCAAACGGHLEVLKWLHNTGCPWDSRTCAGT